MKNINDVFGQSEAKAEVKEEKTPAITPFDFLNAINFTKENLIVDDWSEKQYVPFIVNRGLGYGADTVIQANEMNSRPHIDKKLQFDFLINNVRPKKRFNKWLKAERLESVEIIKQYYGYSTNKAHQVLSLLSDTQIEHIKRKLEKGGM